MARLSSVSLNALLLLLLVPGCKAQSAGASAALDPTTVHRIKSEIRSRYNVPSQVEITLSDPKPGSIAAGYDDLVVTFHGSTKETSFDFLLSKDRKTLARLEKVDISQDLMSKIDVKGRPIRGGEKAKVTIVNYDDFQCPYCSSMHAELFPALQNYGDKVKVVYKDYPLLEIHPWAMHAAIDANCLADQNGSAYWDFADYVHANRTAITGHSQQEAFTNLDSAATTQASKYHLDLGKAQACFKKQDESAVRLSMAEGDKLGVDSTPTLFVNGERISGVIPPDQLRAIVDRALADAGEQVPPRPASNSKPSGDSKN